MAAISVVAWSGQHLLWLSRGGGFRVGGWGAAVSFGYPHSVCLVDFSIVMYLVGSRAAPASVVVFYVLVTWRCLRFLWLPRGGVACMGGSCRRLT